MIPARAAACLIAGAAIMAAAPVCALKPNPPTKAAEPATKAPPAGASHAAIPKPPPAKLPAEPPRGDAEARVADWISASNDNGALPYAIIDKTAAEIRLFDARGNFRGMAPVLIGIAIGDDATPGVGIKKLAQLGPAEKTTPAGRYIARYGLPVDGERVLWVDYGMSVAMHPIPRGTEKEHRRERMLSPTPDDNRITFGCINLPLAFYTSKVRPAFLRKGGVVYILPDTKPLEDVFPRLHAQPFVRLDYKTPG